EIASGFEEGDIGHGKNLQMEILARRSRPTPPSSCSGCPEHLRPVDTWQILGTRPRMTPRRERGVSKLAKISEQRLCRAFS
ncbi:hypothetical protein ACCT19_37095, partial [Rhizobium ruizarguesonis]